MRALKTLAALGLLISAMFWLTGAFFQPPPLIEMSALGAIGDGVSINNNQFAEAFTRVGVGGKIHLPCGVYKITSTPVANILAGQHAEMVGDGVDCSVIFISGAIAGPTFNLLNQWSSVRVADLTVATDQLGGHNCMIWQSSTVVASPAASATNNMHRVTFRGLDAYAANTMYCGAGLYESNVSNINIDGLTFQGIPGFAGTAISANGTINGNGAASSVQINISNSVMNLCNIATYYGDWVQGINWTNVNATGCQNGVTTVASPSGVLSQLAIVNSQIAAYTCGVCINDTQFADLIMTNSVLIIYGNATGVLVQGTNFILNGVQLASTTNGGPNTGIEVGSTFGNGGSINNLTLLQFGTGIKVDPASQAPVRLNLNQFVDARSAPAEVDYNISARASSVLVFEKQPRNLAVIRAQLPCNSAIKYSVVMQADSPTPTYHGIASHTTDDATPVSLLCDGKNYRMD
jgi:hypothetical protein